MNPDSPIRLEPDEGAAAALEALGATEPIDVSTLIELNRMDGGAFGSAAAQGGRSGASDDRSGRPKGEQR